MLTGSIHKVYLLGVAPLWSGLLFAFASKDNRTTTQKRGGANMSEQTQGTEPITGPTVEQVPDTLRDFLWTLPQPVLVLGSMLAVASAFTFGWAEPKLFALFMIILPLPLVLLAERIWVKRQDWILTPKEFAEDAF